MDTLAELNEIKKQLLADISQLREQAREYEEGMRYTREEDKKRKVALDTQEMDLKARERKLIQESADFEKRKRRFYQLKEIS